MSEGDEETGEQMFRRACDLMHDGDYANALPLFEQVQMRDDVSQRGWDSCNANIAQCANHTGDFQKVLTYTAMFLESSAAVDAAERAQYLEMFYGAYKGRSGISYHNPFNEY